MTHPRSTSKSEVSIRSASPAEAPAIFELRIEALTLEPESFAADVELTLENGTQSWVDLITNYEKDQSGVLMLAWASDQLVGMTGLFRRNWPKTRHFGSIWGVYVRPGWRGQHIAGDLINGCLDWALAHELKVVNLGVSIFNQPAIRCYARCGFSIYATEPKTLFYNGAVITH